MALFIRETYIHSIQKDIPHQGQARTMCRGTEEHAGTGRTMGLGPVYAKPITSEVTQAEAVRAMLGSHVVNS